MKSLASELGLTLTSSANSNIRRVLSRDCQEEKKGKNGLIGKIHSLSENSLIKSGVSIKIEVASKFEYSLIN